MTMQKLEAGDAATESENVVADNIEKLKALFPELVTEGKDGAAVNVDVLKQLVGDQTLTDADEKYGLNWFGKRRARQLALTPSTGTLRPCPEDSVDWDTTQNLMIEGDNLEVLKLLKKSYSSKNAIKLIYIDPPYNRDADVIYPDDFSSSIANYQMLVGQRDTDGRRLTSASEASGRLHTKWLRLIYPRLKVARNLLRHDGVLFISIDEREYASLRLMCCEIFGEENIVGTIVWKNATDNNPTNVATEHEYILVVARSKQSIDAEWKSGTSDIKGVLEKVGSDLLCQYTGQELTDAYEDWYKAHKAELGPLDRYKYIDEGGIYTGSQSVHNPGREGYRYDVIHPATGKACKQPLMGYRFPEDTMKQLLADGRILFGNDESKIVELKLYASEFKDKLSSVFELDGRLGAYDLKEDFPDDGRVFTNPKPARLLSTLFSFLLRDDRDIALDFFAGSGTTAKAVWALNRDDHVTRRFILVQLPEPLDPTNKDQKAAADFCDQLGKPRNIAELTKERLRRAGAKVKANNADWHGDTGFRVFKLDSSNIRAWEPQPDDLDKSLLDSVNHLKPGRSEADVLYELLLKLGLDLCVPIETRRGEQLDVRLRGHDELVVHSVGGGTLIACLAEKIAGKDVEALAQGIVKWHEEQNPAGDITCVFRDSAFADDVAKANLAAILEQHGIANVRSL